MAIIYFHGTTAEQLPSIRQHGLRKGTFVSPERGVAREFACERAGWNDRRPIVLRVEDGHLPIKKDRAGRPEARLLAVERRCEVAVQPGAPRAPQATLGSVCIALELRESAAGDVVEAVLAAVAECGCDQCLF